MQRGSRVAERTRNSGLCRLLCDNSKLDCETPFSYQLRFVECGNLLQFKFNVAECMPTRHCCRVDHFRQCPTEILQFVQFTPQASILPYTMQIAEVLSDLTSLRVCVCIDIMYISVRNSKLTNIGSLRSSCARLCAQGPRYFGFYKSTRSYELRYRG